jgi:hypothetical protein
MEWLCGRASVTDDDGRGRKLRSSLQCRRHGFRKWRGRTADEFAEMTTLIEKSTFGSSRIGVGKQFCQDLGETGADKCGLEFFFGQILVGNGLA